MGSIKLDEILSTPLDIISVSGGNVMRAMRSDDVGYAAFGEAYFSQVLSNSIKAWKKHTKMQMNLIVPVGKVGFVFFDEDVGVYRTEVIGENNYKRLTVPPGVWFGFKGLGEFKSLILNIGSVHHSPGEVERKDFDEFNFDWSVL